MIGLKCLSTKINLLSLSIKKKSKTMKKIEMVIGLKNTALLGMQS